MGYWDELKLHYNALAREGIAVEFVNQESDLTGYGLVVVPMVYLLTDAFAQNSVILPGMVVRSWLHTGPVWWMKAICAAWVTRPTA